MSLRTAEAKRRSVGWPPQRGDRREPRRSRQHVSGRHAAEGARRRGSRAGHVRPAGGPGLTQAPRGEPGLWVPGEKASPAGILAGLTKLARTRQGHRRHERRERPVGHRGDGVPSVWAWEPWPRLSEGAGIPQAADEKRPPGQRSKETRQGRRLPESEGGAPRGVPRWCWVMWAQCTWHLGAGIRGVHGEARQFPGSWHDTLERSLMEMRKIPASRRFWEKDSEFSLYT